MEFDELEIIKNIINENINLFNFMNIEQTILFNKDFNKILKKAYKKNCIKYHPDKLNNDDENKKQEYIKLFHINKVIYDILSDENKYNKYNDIKNMYSYNDHINLKNNFFKESIKFTSSNNYSLDDIQHTFNIMNDNKFDNNDIKPLTEEETSFKLNELIKNRNISFINNESSDFNNKKFNDEFDIIKKNISQQSINITKIQPYNSVNNIISSHLFENTNVNDVNNIDNFFSLQEFIENNNNINLDGRINEYNINKK